MICTAENGMEHCSMILVGLTSIVVVLVVIVIVDFRAIKDT
jgi:hypothetical protein